MTKSKTIILASTSPFRKKLLEDAGVLFDVKGAIGDEKTIFGFPPKILASKRAEFKAKDVADQVNAPAVIIGADQVLGLDNISYDKAETESEALDRLMQFQGKVHVLYSALCLVQRNITGGYDVLWSDVVDIPMTMRPLTLSEAREYIQTGEWQGCVGCYRIEGKGRSLFSHIGGEIDAIIGLPVPPLLKALKSFI